MHGRGWGGGRGRTMGHTHHQRGARTIDVHKNGEAYAWGSSATVGTCALLALEVQGLGNGGREGGCFWVTTLLGQPAWSVRKAHTMPCTKSASLANRMVRQGGHIIPHAQTDTHSMPHPFHPHPPPSTPMSPPPQPIPPDHPTHPAAQPPYLPTQPPNQIHTTSTRTKDALAQTHAILVPAAAACPALPFPHPHPHPRT